MHLHDLVTLRKALVQNLVTDPVVSELFNLRTRLIAIKVQVPVLGEEYNKYIDDLVDQYDLLIDQVNLPVEELQNKLKIIDQQIGDLTHKLFAGNYELEEHYGSVDFIRNSRRIYVRTDVEDVIKQRILLYTSWKYPALEIGCRDGEWTQYMVASDPLYIMDRHTEFLDSTNSKFPTAYQQRLRKYPLINHDLSGLPANQMNFVFSWGYFNYVSLDTMKQYLRQVYTVLRPGGVFMFSYNDGDTPAGAGMAENFAQTYMPKSMLKPLCESLGFEISKEFDFEPNISWIEISKPGELKTVKAHQVMGEIKHINN
jgi:SAM-dependent methyltransferase